MGECKKCGKCCKSLILAVDPNYGRKQIDLLILKENYKKSINFDHAHWLLFKSRCKHLGLDNKCKIYDKRPEACREWPDKESKKYWRELYPECGYFD